LSYCTGDWILSIDADERLEEGGIEKIHKEIDDIHDSIDVFMMGGECNFYFPRIIKKGVKWMGAIHNYPVIAKRKRSNIIIRYGYSPAHKKDPDRAIRILTKEVKNGSGPREIFYLAREYIYRKEYGTAIYWYDQYLQKALWAPEMAEANLQRARAYLSLGNLRKAQQSALEAVRINSNFKEAVLFLASITGPKNSKRWEEFAKTATNEDVLFIRDMEKDSSYYDKLFQRSSDMSRYENIYTQVGSWAKGKCLDVGCGTAELQHHIKDYHGFDFSRRAVTIANNKQVKVGDAYEEDLRGYDTYILLEVLEHLDDLKILKRLPKGKDVIFSVPSFKDPSHMRVYTEESMRERFKPYLDISEVIRFNWDNKWVKGGKETGKYILLCKARIC
jgi:tetratricopeptide (TPR) repeat protein